MKNSNLFPVLTSTLLGGALIFITGCSNGTSSTEKQQKQEQQKQQEQEQVIGTVTAKIETKSGEVIDYNGIIVDDIMYNTAANWEEIKGKASAIVVKSYMKKDGIEYNLNLMLNLTVDGNPIGTYYDQNQSEENPDTGFSTLSFNVDNGETKQYGSGSWSDNSDLTGSMGNATVHVTALTHQEMKATFSGVLKETFAAGKDDQGVFKVSEGTIDTAIQYQLLK